MLCRLLTLLTVLTLACASAQAYVPERSLLPQSELASSSKTAPRGFAARAEPAAKEKSRASDCCIRENWHPPLKLASSMQFTGHYREREGSSYYAQQRYYRPGLGRFNRVDPWEGDPLRPVTLNKYLAFNGNPLRFFDPDGRQSIAINVTSCTEDGSCSTAPMSGSALHFLSPSQMATQAQADSLLEAQARSRLFADGRTAEPMVAQSLVTSGAGRFVAPQISHGQSPTLSSMQSSADLDRALGYEPNYVPYGRGTDAAGQLAFNSVPIVGVVEGGRRIYNAEGVGDVVLGTAEIALGVVPTALAVRTEVAAMRSEMASVRAEASLARQQSRAAVVIESPSELSPGALVQARVAELKAAIPENSRGRITMAVGVAEDTAGRQSVLIGTSEPRGYLRPGVELRPGERMVPGTGHAEADIVSYAATNDLRVVSIGATRPVCQGCQQTIQPTAAEIATPLKKPKN